MSLGWDPADYGGAQTFVGAIYSYELDLAGYVTVQEIKKPLISQLDPELQPLGLKGKLIRTESWNELRALSHALSHVGFGLDDIRVPQVGAWWSKCPRKHTSSIRGVLNQHPSAAQHRRWDVLMVGRRWMKMHWHFHVRV